MVWFAAVLVPGAPGGFWAPPNSFLNIFEAFEDDQGPNVCFTALEIDFWLDRGTLLTHHLCMHPAKGGAVLVKGANVRCCM